MTPYYGSRVGDRGESPPTSYGGEASGVAAEAPGSLEPSLRAAFRLHFGNDCAAAVADE